MPRFSLLIFSILFLISCNKKSPEFTTTFIDLPEDGLPAFIAYDDERLPLVSAHRGGPEYEGFPENCIATFQYVSSKVPAIIECDVEMTKDSVLIMMHDNTLDRTTTGSGRVQEMTWAEMKNLNLVDNFGNTTDFKIPLLTETLEWADGKALLTLDVKRGVPFDLVLNAVEGAEAEEYAMVIAYNIGAAKKIHNLNSEVVISVPMRNDEEVDRMLDTGIPTNRMVAFTGTRESSPELYKRINDLGIQCILGVFGNLDNRAKARGGRIYRECVENGVDILATDRPIEAFEAIMAILPEVSNRMQYLNE
ncbi:MAG: glycerophosphodiester phosphodiesterase family protein [Bacteroidota bacterium]